MKIDPGSIPTIPAEEVLRNALNTIYFVIGAIAVTMIIYAGITYVTSAGDAAKVGKAKNTILYSVIGLIVAILAFVITFFVMDVFK